MPSVSEVVLGNEVLISLRNDTVTADKLMRGITAHDKSGEIITGTAGSYVQGTTAYFPSGQVDGTTASV